jgi:hypothetical protein
MPTGELVIRMMLFMMLTSVICGVAVLRMRQPGGFRDWTRSSSGAVRAVFLVVLLFACWLLPFSLTAIALGAIEKMTESFILQTPETRLALLVGVSSTLWLAFYVLMLSEAKR